MQHKPYEHFHMHLRTTSLPAEHRQAAITSSAVFSAMAHHIALIPVTYRYRWHVLPHALAWARNQAHFEFQIRKGGRFSHGINRAVYRAALTLRATQTKKQKRVTLFKEAVQSGKHGVLGVGKLCPR